MQSVCCGGMREVAAWAQTISVIIVLTKSQTGFHMDFFFFFEGGGGGWCRCVQRGTCICWSTHWGFVGFNEFKDKNNCQIQLQYIKPTIVLYFVIAFLLWCIPYGSCWGNYDIIFKISNSLCTKPGQTCMLSGWFHMTPRVAFFGKLWLLVTHACNNITNTLGPSICCLSLDEVLWQTKCLQREKTSHTKSA